MSATNRSDVREPDDFYVTPAWTTRAILRLLPRTPGPVLEPGCGTGAIMDVLRESGREDLVGVELHAGRAAAARAKGHRVIEGNFLDDAWEMQTDFETPYALIVGNPPYSLAMEFIERSKELLAPNGRIAFLLRLGFAESIERAQWHRDNPADLKVLPKRPSFCAVVSCERASAKGGATCDFRESFPARGVELPTTCPKCGAETRVSRSDSAAYGWWLFGHGVRGTWTTLPVTDDMLEADEPMRRVRRAKGAPKIEIPADAGPIVLPPDAKVEMVAAPTGGA